MSFGKNLRNLREKRGIERKSLAQIFDMPYNTLKNYENDEREPGHKFLVKVAQFFEVSTDFLLDNNIDELKASSPHFDNIELSKEVLEVACAYSSASLHDKNTVRYVLRLPSLEEP